METEAETGTMQLQATKHQESWAAPHPGEGVEQVSQGLWEEPAPLAPLDFRPRASLKL